MDDDGSDAAVAAAQLEAIVVAAPAAAAAQAEATLAAVPLASKTFIVSGHHQKLRNYGPVCRIHCIHVCVFHVGVNRWIIDSCGKLFLLPIDVVFAYGFLCLFL